MAAGSIYTHLPFLFLAWSQEWKCHSLRWSSSLVQTGTQQLMNGLQWYFVQMHTAQVNKFSAISGQLGSRGVFQQFFTPKQEWFYSGRPLFSLLIYSDCFFSSFAFWLRSVSLLLAWWNTWTLQRLHRQSNSLRMAHWCVQLPEGLLCVPLRRFQGTASYSRRAGQRSPGHCLESR